jgi:hypothetical protein
VGGEGGGDVTKLGKSWAFISSPLGYDPYDSISRGFLVNADYERIRDFREKTVATEIVNMRLRGEIFVEPPKPTPPFSGDPFSI